MSYNKRFLYAGVSAPGSVHDSRLIKSSSIFERIMNGDAIPKSTFSLGDFVEVPLVTIGDSAFPSYTWLLKCYNESTRDNQKRNFNSKLCGARVVTENCYGMLKVSFRILSVVRTTQSTLFILDNLCIKLDDLCDPRWKLQVQHR